MCGLVTAADGTLAETPADGSLIAEDLSGWNGELEHWSVKDGVLIGKATSPLEHNSFIWHDGLIGDFYLSALVKLTPDDRNSGIQFRSTKLPPFEAVGYQADMGKTYWGRLYHESGRGKLVWNEYGESVVKPGEWNRYEILAVGDRIWLAVNGVVSVAVEDPAGERRGELALQLHSGPSLEVQFKELNIVHDPQIALAGKNAVELISMLHKLEVNDE